MEARRRLEQQMTDLLNRPNPSDAQNAVRIDLEGIERTLRDLSTKEEER